MKDLVSEIRSIIETSRSNAIRSVDFCRVQMYWQIGRRIVEEEPGRSARAEYGKGLIKNLAQEIEPEYGSGFSYRQLNFARQFFLEYPKMNTLRSQFNWTQYRALIQISDKDKREYYELEAESNWRCHVFRFLRTKLVQELEILKAANYCSDWWIANCISQASYVYVNSI